MKPSHYALEDEDPPPRPPTVASVMRRLRALYSRADRVYLAYSCPASGECCQLSKRQRQPWLWLPEWLMLEDALRRAGRDFPAPRSDGGCPFLDATGARCTVYESRPFGCRTFFCSRARGPANQPLEKVIDLSFDIEALALELDDTLTGPKPLLDWLKTAT